ncbi:F-box protein At3g17710-like [Cornus florida]|uniref:F-box protein At3g17710-like n=1 Tax=Cornus florida TaxID=4283 RepID=UPI002899D568|nr:F-box protein At3g17710-like [Cornus florida]
MMSKLMADKSSRLARLVEERALSKMEEKKKQQENLVPYIPPYLPKECIYSILVQLPPEALQRLRFVCKPWYKMVNSSIFIDDHLRRAETVFIFLTRAVKGNLCPYSMPTIPQEKSNTFSVEENLFQSQSLPLFQRPQRQPMLEFYIQFMEIKNGKSKIREFNVTCLGKIRATCNGLILLDNKMNKGGLIVLNPVTKKLIALPLGTIYPPHSESFGLVLCNYTSEYKLIHLFEDEMRYIGCEILILGTRSWRMVDGPPFGLFSWLGCNPISAIGALHWIPDIDRSDYLVSMSTDDEKFHKTPLPKSCRSYDGIVEMGGLLSFMTHEETGQIDIWILRGLNGEDWIKQHSITVGCSMEMIPLYCSRVKGEVIFKDKDGSMYAYDFEHMKKVDIEKGFPINGCYLPHVNSLVSWQIEDKDLDVGY